MTEIASVAETFRWLGATVALAKHKLPSYETDFALLEDGIEISVAANALVNRIHVSWDELLRQPALLSLRASQCAGELMRLADARRDWRERNALDPKTADQTPETP